MFEPPPSDENALADNVGLMLNCINSALYMVRSYTPDPSNLQPACTCCLPDVLVAEGQLLCGFSQPSVCLTWTSSVSASSRL